MLRSITSTLRETMHRAVRAHQSGDLDEAARLYNRVLRAVPNQFDALHLLGAVEGQRGRHGKAHQLLSQAVKINPGSAEALNNLGNVLWKMRRYEDAASAFEKALRMRPNLVPALNNWGNALRRDGRYEEALKAYASALALEPGYAAALSNYGDVLQDLGRTEEAIAWHDKALAIDPRDPKALTNRGIALQSLLLIDEALEMYTAALAIDPDFKAAQYNEAVCRLLTGDLSRGWPKFELRWETEADDAGRRDLPKPLWLGNEELAGKSILLHAEEGFGDTIQFCRYAPLAARKGARVILEVPALLKSLMRSLDGVDVLIDDGEPPPSFDFHCPLMSLPLAFGTTLESIPSAARYLAADPAQVALWRERLTRFAGAKVGLAWAGNPRRHDAPAYLMDQRRSMRLSQFGALAQHSGATFISLQKGEPSNQATSPAAGLHVVDWTEELLDFADTAALVEALDLVICVDTSVAHLAGALGKPVWMLSRFESEWRWLLDRADSPWYPTMKIFRQPSRGDWEAVVEQVSAELGRWAGPRAQP
ncbi:MAG TPA: tetratricopeptide repeat-containing glycosyltransferase family protein [Stellaceae bacterium]|nr:tetratricopeptide repeat-containing glycosyltransferase family protein [Stellaceae bacterium]